MFSWYKANSEGLNVEIKEPNVFVSQIQGPKSMELLDNLIETLVKEKNEIKVDEEIRKKAFISTNRMIDFSKNL